MTMPRRPELLSPAGDPESLAMAVEYGADAVYLGLREFSMRAGARNFTLPELQKAVEYAHPRGVKIYLACNTLPRNGELARLPELLHTASECGVDAFIVSDLGVLQMAKQAAPGVELHVSTQAGVVNYAAAGALYSLGARRVVLARELSLGEIAEIRRSTPEGLALETFVHGAMCVSFSGRCLLSDYLTGRGANRGECAQPCRWNYSLVEQTRPGVYLPVSQDEKGTHILSSRDLCMIGHIPELVRAGVSSLKIEGRAKSPYYTAAVTSAYRRAVDDACAGRPFNLGLAEELNKVSHRSYCTGFYFGPLREGQDPDADGPAQAWEPVAVSEGRQGEYSLCRLRNRLAAGETLEALEPGGDPFAVNVRELCDENGALLREAACPDMRFLLKSSRPLRPFAWLRRPIPGPAGAESPGPANI